MISKPYDSIYLTKKGITVTLEPYRAVIYSHSPEKHYRPKMLACHITTTPDVIVTSIRINKHEQLVQSVPLISINFQQLELETVIANNMIQIALENKHDKPIYYRNLRLLGFLAP